MAQARHDSVVSIDLYRLLRMFGLEEGRAVKIYRHEPHVHDAAVNFPYRGDTSVIDVEKVYRRGLLPHFQARLNQAQVGKENDLAGAFIKEEDGSTRFVGMFKILSRSRDHSSLMAREALQHKFLRKGMLWHELELDPRFNLLRDRLVISWQGRGSNRWLVSSKGKIAEFEVQEIRSPGAFLNFPGFGRTLLSYPDLKIHFEHEQTSPWVRVLKSTRGIYLITDRKNGHLYVGSATGRDGLWGRWRQYAATDHGGNKLIKLGIENKSLAPDDFQIAVLETLSNLATKKDGTDAEKIWKEKLGRKAVTLNGN